VNPITFFEQQIQIYNEDEKCDSCWSFSAPLKESAINITQPLPDEKCCVKVFLTDLTTSQNNEYNNTTNYITRKTCDYTFNLFVLKDSTIGRNNYDEMKGYSIDESKWKLIFEPLEQCMGCDAQLDFCDIMGFNIQVPRWSMSMVHNYLDQNYDGWKISATFRITV
jgi:hypothetical protein